MGKGNWRDSLTEKLLDILHTRGVDDFLNVAVSMLDVKAGDAGKVKAQFVGEVGEAVIVGLTEEYLKLTGRKARVFHSVILKDLHSVQSDFRTELDFLLVSEGFMLTTECKSFAGEVKVTGYCTFQHRAQEHNLYAQSKLHVDKLLPYAQRFTLPGLRIVRPPVYANAFLFSNAEIKDMREASKKEHLRVHTTSTLFDFYDAMFRKYQSKVFDYARACRVFEQAASSEKLHAEHKSYLGYKE